MNRLMFFAFLAAAAFSSCSKDDDDNTNGKDETLVSPELEVMMATPEATTSAFTGALMVYPCLDDSSFYYGNYSVSGKLSPMNAFYTVKNGSIAKSPIPVRLPVGDYNFLYWGVAVNSTTDSTYDDVSINEPGLRLGAVLSDLTLSLRKTTNLDTVYDPVYDYLHATNPIQVGTEKMKATLKRAVAGLKVTLKNKDNSKMSGSIASARILIGNIAADLNYYTADPSDFTKTVAFPLEMSADSMSMSANSTVMVFPSSDNPPLTILLTLKNGLVKKYQKPLASALTAGNRTSLTITLGELYSEETSSDGFDVENWTESNETISFPAG